MTVSSAIMAIRSFIVPLRTAIMPLRSSALRPHQSAPGQRGRRDALIGTRYLWHAFAIATTSSAVRW